MTREEAAKTLAELWGGVDYHYCLGTIGVEAVDMAIKALQEPERKHGKWIKHEDDERISGTCSCCGWDALLYETDVVGMPFCPNCGAEMGEK